MMQEFTMSGRMFWLAALIVSPILLVTGMHKAAGGIILILGLIVFWWSFWTHAEHSHKNPSIRKYGERCSHDFKMMRNYTIAFAVIGLGSGFIVFGMPGVLGMIILPAIMLLPTYSWTYADISGKRPWKNKKEVLY